jgi:hypothetical protein
LPLLAFRFACEIQMKLISPLRPQKTLNASPYEEAQSIRPKNIKQKFIQEKGYMLIIANKFY